MSSLRSFTLYLALVVVTMRMCGQSTILEKIEKRNCEGVLW